MSLPYFNLYPSDFEAKTSHLTLEEDGAYNRLLRLCWMTPGCSLPDDDAWIMRRMRVDAETYERVVRVVLDEFFTRTNGRVTNPRIAREAVASAKAHKRRVDAGKMGCAAKSAKTKDTAPSNATAMPKQPEPEPEPIKSPPTPQGVSFADFWSSWPDKQGKAAAEKAWKKLKPDERTDAARLAAPWFRAWRAKHPDASPIHASSFLNQKRWQDEGEQKPPEIDRVQIAANNILSGKDYLCKSISASQARYLIDRGLVTEAQCKTVGVI